MFDNLRDMSDNSGLFQEQPEERPEPTGPRIGTGRIFGMTAGQRFLLSLLLFAAVVMIGVMCLLVTEKVALF